MFFLLAALNPVTIRAQLAKPSPGAGVVPGVAPLPGVGVIPGFWPGFGCFPGGDCSHHDPRPEEPPRPLCFNLVCNFSDEKSTDFKKCTVAANFTKKVTDDGWEIWDDSEPGSNPTFEIECNSEVIFNGSAHRYTDRQGTRLQAETATFPSLVIPKNSLREGHRYTSAVLELQNQQHMDGFCYLYTGPQ